MLLYAITDRRLTPALEPQAARLAASGVTHLQIREKDLGLAELGALTRAVVDAVSGSGLRVLVNGPASLAREAGAQGVHLTATAPLDQIAAARLQLPGAIVSVSCHSAAAARAASSAGADLVLFAPVFEKALDALTLPGQGLAALEAACRVATPVPVLALGGVTRENAQLCLSAGAAGVAGIRLFAGEGAGRGRAPADISLD